MKTENISTINLDKGDGALVLRANGKMQIILPKGDKDEQMSPVELLLSALYVNFNDAKFTDKMIAKAFRKEDLKDEVI